MLRAAAGVLALAAASAFGQGATTINPASLPFTDTVDTSANSNTIDNSVSAGLPRGGGSPDAYWNFTPNQTGVYTIDFSGFDTAFAIFTENAGELVEELAVDSVIGIEASNFAMSAGTRYTLLGEGFNQAAFGHLTLAFAGPFAPSANDTCEMAIEIDPASLPFEQTIDTSGNSQTRNNSVSSSFRGFNSPDAYWRMTPDVTGDYLIEATGFDTAFAVLTGSCGALAEMQAVDETTGEEAAFISLTAGTTYYFQVEGFSEADFGSLTFRVTLSSPSTNDTCATATTITPGELPFIQTVDTTRNTHTIDNSASLAVNGGGGSPDALWKFTPAQTDIYRIAADGFDTAIGVFTGSCGSLTEVFALDAFVGDEEAFVFLESGMTYTIVGEGFGPGDVGELTLTLDGPLAPTANDTCSGATVIDSTSLPFTDTVNTGLNFDTIDNSASLAFDPPGGSSPDAFWSFTPTQSGEYYIGAGGFDTAIAVFLGNCADIVSNAAGQEVASVDDFVGPEFLKVNLNAGQTYTIMGEGFGGGDVGMLDFFLDGPIAPSANDDCSNATLITPGQLPFTQTISTLGNAHSLDNSASMAFMGGASPDAFWEFTPDQTGPYRIDVAGFDTAFAVFTGNCGSLIEVAAFDQFIGPEAANVVMTAGTRYFIMGEGFNAFDVGAMIFNLSGPFATTDNDTFAGARTIAPGALPFNDTADTTANTDTIENSASSGIAGGGNSPDAYWTFTPTQSGCYTISATGFDTAVAIFTGSAPPLDEILAVDDVPGGETATLRLLAGTTYTILAEGFGELDFGLLTLDVQGPNAPPLLADVCDQAIPIPPTLPYTNANDTECHSDTITNSASDMLIGGGESPDVWYHFIPGVTGLYSVRVASAFDSAFGIFTGACGALTEILALDDFDGPEVTTIELQAGVSYRIVVEGNGADNFGAYDLTVDGPHAPSANDKNGAPSAAGPAWRFYD